MASAKEDELAKSQNWDGKVKSSSFKARKFRVIRRTYSETFEKCSILFKFKAGENFNRRNTLSILRIKI